MIEDSGSLAGTTIGVVGAGMMGGAIAYTCARAGADVVLVARTLDGARRGKSYGERREARLLATGTTEPAVSQALLDRITTTEGLAELVLQRHLLDRYTILIVWSSIWLLPSWKRCMSGSPVGSPGRSRGPGSVNM